ncbi:hypothetical protein [Duganella phyllosphaerae]|uniref:Uncharacterized protein n=1 Tax=Duganella phyllosphaerae TaxID=762836 RepID=A0A1E7WZW9_9BURK|nr:hypothetical protein [Duganella phyllosphaerae]OFA05377.1 hypothetical protein DUPY_14910 [Duganella phyllosphaerae]
MLDYLVQISVEETGKQFVGTFSDADLVHLLSPRTGRAFDLENYKAYLTPDGKISLARKPSYEEYTTLTLAELVRALRSAVSIKMW